VLGGGVLLWNMALAAGLAASETKNDFGRMYYSAAAWWEGQDMYRRTPAVPTPPLAGHSLDLWNLNPPHFHLILLPLARLPLGPALAAWAVLNGLCLLSALRCILRETGWPVTPSWGIVAALCMLGSAPMTAVVITGQLSFLLLLPVTLAWRAARQERWAACGAWLGLVLSIKPFLLLVVPYLLLRRRLEALAALAGSVAGCFALGLLVFGLDSHRSWQARLAVADSWSWLAMNGSLLGMLSRTCSANLLFTPLLDLGPGPLRGLWLAIGGVLGLLTLAAYMKLGHERRNQVGERYVPSWAAPSGSPAQQR